MAEGRIDYTVAQAAAVWGGGTGDEQSKVQKISPAQGSQIIDRFL